MSERRCSACGGAGKTDLGTFLPYPLWPICKPCNGIGWIETITPDTQSITLHQDMTREEFKRRYPDSPASPTPSDAGSSQSGVKWTPGPWEYRCDTDRHYVGWGACCIVEETFATRETKERGTKERKANAQLIAAAPDLYEALTKLPLDAFDGNNMADFDAADFVDNARAFFDCIQAARVALAKARGEQ